MTLGPKDERDPLDQVVIPIHAEEVSIGKRQVVTGRLTVSTITHSREELVQELLRKERVEIERVPVGQVVQEVPQVREEGDLTIIPVVEETVFIERRLVLKEEVRIRRIHETQNYQECVVLRTQEAVITRVPGDSNPPAGPRLEDNSTRKREEAL
jgi:stress response protein YsnF